MSIEHLHEKVLDVCKTNFGVAIGLNVLQLALEREISLLGGSAFGTGLPTSFGGLKASVKIDPAKVTIAPNSAEARFDVNAEFQVIIHRPGDVNQYLGRYNLAFVDATAKLLEDNRIGGQLAIILESRGAYNMAPDPRPTEFEDRLKAQGIVDPVGKADVASYDRFEAAAFLFSPDVYLDALLASLPVPEIRESLRAIRLVSPLQIDFISTHVIVHSPNVEFDNPICPRTPFNNSELTIERGVDTQGVAKTHVKINEVVRSPAIELARVKNASIAAVNPSLDAAFLYYYPKGVLFDWSFGALKPSVTFSDRGSKFAIYWFYNLSAALKKIKVSFRAISPTQGVIVIEAPVEVNGNSGAGIKIGCVKFEVLSVRCNGDIDPLVIEVEGGISGVQGDLYIDGQIKNVKVDIDWRTTFGFPFDQIADWILDRILNKEVKKIVGREVNLYRRNISLLTDVLFDIRLYISGIESNAKAESILYAVNLNEG